MMHPTKVPTRVKLLVREIELSEDAIRRHIEVFQRLNLGSEILIVS